MESDEVAERIDAERLDAAHSEWERHERVRRVLLPAVEQARSAAIAIAHTTFGDERTIELVGTIEGIRLVLTGEWLQSPKAMLATRAPRSEGNGTED